MSEEVSELAVTCMQYNYSLQVIVVHICLNAFEVLWALISLPPSPGSRNSLS